MWKMSTKDLQRLGSKSYCRVQWKISSSISLIDGLKSKNLALNWNIVLMVALAAENLLLNFLKEQEIIGNKNWKPFKRWRRIRKNIAL